MVGVRFFIGYDTTDITSNTACGVSLVTAHGPADQSQGCPYGVATRYIFLHSTQDFKVNEIVAYASGEMRSIVMQI